MDRRLRVVLFVDVVGYTNLSSTDERTAIGVAETLRGVAEEAVAKRDGRVVKHLGDGMIAVFDGARHGTEAALEIGHAFSLATSGLPGGPHRLRLGLHMGEITETEAGDIFGDAVNRAARIQSEAEPGEVFVSEAMSGLLRQDRRFAFDDRGERNLKGIDEPVRVFRVRRADAPPTVPASSAPAPSPHPLRDLRVRRWALAMGTTVALAAFSFLIVGTGALSSFGSPNEAEPTLDDGAPPLAQTGRADTDGQPAGETEQPTDGPDERAEGGGGATDGAGRPSGTVERPSGDVQPAGPVGRNPETDRAPADADVPADPPPAGSQDDEDPAPPERTPLTDGEVAELYELLFDDPQAVVNRLGLDQPTDEREELLRVTALVLAGHGPMALERLRAIEARPELAMRVPAVTRASFHFRVGDLRGAERILSTPGAVGASQVLDAAILRARILGASGDLAGARDLLNHVPSRVQDELWRGWRSYFELAAGTDEPGAAFLRSLGGRRAGGDGAHQYVNALLMHQLGSDFLARA